MGAGAAPRAESETHCHLAPPSAPIRSDRVSRGLGVQSQRVVLGQKLLGFRFRVRVRVRVRVRAKVRVRVRA